MVILGLLLLDGSEIVVVLRLCDDDCDWDFLMFWVIVVMGGDYM